MLAKTRHFVSQSDLKNIFHAVFASQPRYGAQIWTPKLISLTDKISHLQTSPMLIMTYSEFKAHREPLFRELEILKFNDSIILIIVFVFDYLHGSLPESLLETFHRVDESRSYSTRQGWTGMLFTPRYNSSEYGLKGLIGS